MEDPAFAVFLALPTGTAATCLLLQCIFKVWSGERVAETPSALFITVQLATPGREVGLCMIRELISVSFVKLFLCKNNKNRSFSFTPFCQLQSPSVCLSSSLVWHTQEANSVLWAFEVGGPWCQSRMGWKGSKDRVGRVWIKAGRTTKVICKFAFCL